MIPTVSEPDPPPGRPAGPADPAGPGDPPASGDGMREFIARLRGSKRIGGDVVHVETLPAEPAAFAPFAAPLPAPLEGALRALGIDPPWTHQAEAIDRIRRGEDVLTVTPTASGKSLIYLVPTFASALERPGSRSLYLFPYKALAQDQLQGIEELSIEVALRGGRNRDSGHPIRAAIYDGDTSDARRREIRAEPPDILITNPDMLHLGILPYHESWRPFFETLDHIVIDELHVYRGIFGSHLHHILKRLMRVAALSGRRPRVIASSATVAQPGRMGEALVGRRFAVVDKSGAPRAERHLMLLNPSGSPYTAATAIVDAALEAGFRTIAFTKARKITELLHSWLLQSAPRWRGKVSSYRSGYLPEERRDIERRLFSGDLRGVISTSALELGVDIGGLDVCVLVGYPGSIVSTWQRIGRVGREDRPALTVLVALPDALDQYFMSHPAQLTTRGFEEVVFDPLNPEVARAHWCAPARRFRSKRRTGRSTASRNSPWCAPSSARGGWRSTRKGSAGTRAAAGRTATSTCARPAARTASPTSAPGASSGPSTACAPSTRRTPGRSTCTTASSSSCARSTSTTGASPWSAPTSSTTRRCAARRRRRSSRRSRSAAPDRSRRGSGGCASPSGSPASRNGGCMAGTVSGSSSCACRRSSSRPSGCGWRCRTRSRTSCASAAGISWARSTPPSTR